MEYWARTEERLAMGISMPEAWYDASVIIVNLQKDPSSENSIDLISIWTPFSSSVWALIGVTIIVCGLIYWRLERLDENANKDDIQNLPMGSVYKASMAFVGSGEYAPTTTPARILNFGLAFWSVLMISAYTANFASFLVIKKLDQPFIGSLEEANAKELTMCVSKGVPFLDVYRKDYPRISLVLKDNNQEKLDGLVKGECKISTMDVASFQVQERMNGECKFFSDYRVEIFAPYVYSPTLFANSFPMC